MEVSVKISNCMDCPSHQVARDPDPTDSFCSDDEAVLCVKSANTELNKQWASGMPWPYKPVTQSCRPYNKRKECEIPDWCPLK